MKILILLSFLITTGCQISDQEKAKKLITQAINEHLQNKESYIPISFDTLVIADMPFEKTYKYYFQKENIENAKQRILHLEPNLKLYEQYGLQDEELYKELIDQKKNATDRLNTEISRLEISRKDHEFLEGFMMNHKFSFFNLNKGRKDTICCLFFFDPSLKHLYATATLDEDNLYTFRFTPTTTHAK
ncbi:MAG: hypothetical protein RSE51_07015 [Bacteroidales bacterium]